MSTDGTARPSLRGLLREKPLRLLALGTLAFFLAPLLLGRSYFFRDLHSWAIPARERLREAVTSGQWPLWDPLIHGGQALLGNVNYMALYPSALLSVVLSPIIAVNLEIALHFALAGLAAYALARVLAISPVAAFLAAAAFVFCGIALSLGNLLNRLLAFPYLALLLLFWHLFLLEGRGRWFLLAAIAGCLQLFAGSAELLALTLPVAALWGLIFPYPDPAPGGRRRLVAALALCLTVAGLAAVQILPMAEILRQSVRGQRMTPEAAGVWSISPRRLPELAVPGFFGRTDSIDDADYWGGGAEDAGFPYLLSIYFGAPLLALALAGGLDRSGQGPLPRRLRIFLLAILAVSIALSLGRHLSPFLSSRSGTIFRYPAKFLMLAPLSIALLAGHAAERAFRDTMVARRLARGLLFVSILIAAALLVSRFEPDALMNLAQTFFDRPADARIRSGLAAGLAHVVLFTALAAIALSLQGRRGGTAGALLLAAAISADLVTAGWRLNATMPRDLLAQAPPIIGPIRRELRDGRLFRDSDPPDWAVPAPTPEAFWAAGWLRATVSSNTATAFGIPVVLGDDFDGLATLRLVQLRNVLMSLPWERRLPTLSAATVRVIATPVDLSLDGLAPLGTEVPGAAIRFYRNERSAAKVELATWWRFVASPAEARASLALAGFDPRRHAVIEGSGPPPSRSPCRRPKVEILRWTRTSEEVRTDSECSGFLVFSEPYYAGWRATRDGEPAAIVPANAAFSAVFVPAGRHEIRRLYRPLSLFAGAAVSLLTLAAAVSLLRARARRRA